MATKRAAARPKEGVPTDWFAATAPLFEPERLRGPASVKKAADALREGRHAGVATDPRTAHRLVTVLGSVRHLEMRDPSPILGLENEAAQLLVAGGWREAAGPLAELLKDPCTYHGLVVQLLAHLGDASVLPRVLDWFDAQSAGVCDQVYYDVRDLLVGFGASGVRTIKQRLGRGPANRYQRYAYESALEGISKKQPYKATISRMTKT